MDPEAEFQSEWESFQEGSAKGCLAGVGFIVLAVGLVVSNRLFPVAGSYLSFAVFVIFLGLGLFLPLRRWPCPGCKMPFDHIRRRSVRYCVSCGLPKFYGSRYYFDLWGTEEGAAMAKRIDDGDL